jgi:RAVE protein 1 C terminal
MTYFDDGPSWELCWKIDISKYVDILTVFNSVINLATSAVPHHINDSIWLSHGTLLIGAGNHILLHGQAKQPSNKEASLNLFEYVARHNGPLDDFHPQMLLQCLLWGKVYLYI